MRYCSVSKGNHRPESHAEAAPTNLDDPSAGASLGSTDGKRTRSGKQPLPEPTSMTRRVAVVGSGIAGLAAAWSLAPKAQVTLFEADAHFGGHAHTVDVTLEGLTHGVDTGFLVFNHRTYPGLTRLFAELGVETAASDMSFSAQCPSDGIEWSGSNLNGVFAQRRNLLRPAFLGMLRDIARFNRETTALAIAGTEAALRETVGGYLARGRYGRAFREWYFLPMIGSIWSCPTNRMMQFPMGTLVRFCHNHGLIQLDDRPQWHTVRGGSRRYVQKMLARIADARLATPVRAVRRAPPRSGVAGVWVATDTGEEHFDEVVLAGHSDQNLALLRDAGEDERAILGAIRYQRNEAVLHTDTTLLPRSRRAWAAWNYERAGDADREEAQVCLHYWINVLQPLPWTTPVIVTLNPCRQPEATKVLRRIDYSHPILDQAAVDAQHRLDEIQGRSHVWFCGAWAGYGFHEDGLQSGLSVAEALLARWQGSAWGQAA
jgi:predicted NAD/FAD-binding protein